jgi:hypothetical protein
MGGLNELTVVSPQFIGTLFVLAAVGWWLLLQRRAEPRQPRRSWLIGGLAALLSLTAVASCINSYFSYLPKVRDVFDVVAANRPPDVAKAVQAVPSDSHSRGEIVRLRVPDNGSGFGRTSALVWLPPQYFSEPEARFPVVYLFHGSPGVPKDWFRGGEADQIALSLARVGKPAILVAPRMSKGWLDDPECVDGVREKVETHVLRDVIPTADSLLRTEASREGRIFAGMSAGGYCALNLGLRNRGGCDRAESVRADGADAFQGAAVVVRSDRLHPGSAEHARVVRREPAELAAVAIVARLRCVRSSGAATDAGACAAVAVAGADGRAAGPAGGAHLRRVAGGSAGWSELGVVGAADVDPPWFCRRLTSKVCG